MSNFYDRWLEEMKATAKLGMCDRFPVATGVARLFTGRRMPERVRRGRFDPSCETWLEELQKMVAAAKGLEGILFRVRLSLTEDWPVEWSESIDRSEKDAAVICLLHRSLEEPLFWAAAVGEPIVPDPPPGGPSPEPASFLQLGIWIGIDGSSVPDEYKALMDEV